LHVPARPGRFAIEPQPTSTLVGRLRSRSGERLDRDASATPSSGFVLPLVLAVGLIVFLPATGGLAADESVLIEEPPTKSVEEESSALERSLEEPKPPEPVLFPRLKRSLEGLPAFFRDTELGFESRTYYFRRRLNVDQNQEALATGGALRYRSGWLFDHVKLGATFFTSQKLRGPEARDGSLLLQERQRSYAVLGESFVQFRAMKNDLTLYRQRFDVPYVNGNDSRMTPNTVEGVTLVGRHERIAYTAGHLLQIKRRNDDHFVSFSEAGGVPGASSNGLSFAGLQIEPIENLSLGAINHYVKDTLNTAYAEVDWLYAPSEAWGIRLASQFTHQRSVGDDRLTGDDFDTWVWGAKVAGSWEEAVLSIAVSVTDDEERIRNPWGSYPGYLAMMQRNFNDADEKAWGLGASFYLGLIGLPDLSVALRYGEGYDRKDAMTAKNLGDRREFNATLDYRLSRGLLRGLWLRGRFGWGHVENTQRDSLEGRLILRYDFQLL